MEHVQERARLWLAANGFEGKVIAQRLYEDRYVVVLDSGPKIDIPLIEMPERPSRELDERPTPEPPPAPKPKRKARRRSKANG